MIIPSLKTAFIDIPKTGSTSITYFLHKVYKDFSLDVPDPLWWSKECSQQMSHQWHSSDNIITVAKTRHHPLISYYKNIPDFYDFLYFSIVRHPFNRFKSFVYETLLQTYFNKPQLIFTSQKQQNNTYSDPWFINSNKSEDWIDQQLRLILHHFHFINLKFLK